METEKVLILRRPIRSEGQYEVIGGPQSLKEAQEWKDLQSGYFGPGDYIIVELPR